MANNTPINAAAMMGATAAQTPNNGMMNLLKNRLFLQYLTAAGQDIAGGNAIGQNFGAAVQQNIAAQSMADIQNQYLKALLGGKIPEGGKVAMDDKGVSIKLPKSTLNNLGSGPQTGIGFDMGPISIGQPTEAMQQSTNEMQGMSIGAPTNPFAFSQLDPSSLAGLSSQDVANALSGAINTTALQESLTAGNFDRDYKTAMLNAKLNQQSQIKPLDKPFSAYPSLTIREFNALPVDEQEYLLAKNEASKLGDDEFMSRREWKATEPAERERFLSGLREDPELILIEKMLAKARNVSDKDSGKVSWTRGLKELSDRFGYFDTTGRFVATPENQMINQLAKQYYAEYENEGELSPLEATNKAESRARSAQTKAEETYRKHLDAAISGNSRYTEEQVKNSYYRQYGYLPNRKK